MDSSDRWHALLVGAFVIAAGFSQWQVWRLQIRVDTVSADVARGVRAVAVRVEQVSQEGAEAREAIMRQLATSGSESWRDIHQVQQESLDRVDERTGSMADCLTRQFPACQK